MLVLLLYARELLFFEPFFVFYLPQDSHLGFGLIIITSGLVALVISMATYRIKTVQSKKNMGTGILGSVLGTGAGICTACSPIGFAILSTFGTTAATTLSFLSTYEIPIRIIAIGILACTFFLMVKPKSTCILIPNKNNYSN